MKLKYYLRGVGIGVLVTTVILAIALDKKPVALTDAQIKARAAELGMVDGKLDISEDVENTTSTTKKNPEAEKPTTTTTTTTKPTTTTKKPDTQKAPEGTVVTIDIGTYDWSNHVAEKFEAAGLVKDAYEFDQYLIDHGYETKIRSGVHDFKVGASYEELAKELISKPKE